MSAQEFGTILFQTCLTLKPYAIKLTKDGEDADDLLQETVFKAYTNRDKFVAETNLKAWLFTIMRNTFNTNYHKLVRRKTFVDTTDNLHYINSAESTTQNQAFENLMGEDIDRELDKLEDAYKKPFIMHFRGFKYFEIAERLKIPLGTVKNRIHIARKILKNKLKVYSPSTN